MKRDRIFRKTPAGLYLIEPRFGSDVVFIHDVNFFQPTPHTVLFEVADTVREVIFRDCGLVNVTVPDDAIIDGGNLIQIEQVPPRRAGDLDFWKLHECNLCCVVPPILRPIARSRDPRYFQNGRFQHHLTKPLYAERRLNTSLVESDLETMRQENLAEETKVRGA